MNHKRGCSTHQKTLGEGFEPKNIAMQIEMTQNFQRKRSTCETV